MTYEEVKDRVEGVFNHLCPGQHRWLFEKSLTLPDDAVILEIGSHRGDATVPLGLPCVGTHRRLYCIDIRLDAPHVQADWKKNVAMCGLEPYVTEIVGDSAIILKTWKEYLDFVFIDGSHEYDAVLADFNLVLPWVKSGGQIALHDICPSWLGPSRVWNEVANKRLVSHEQAATIMCGTKP